MKISRSILFLVLSILIFGSCQKKELKRFKLINPNASGINFNNTIKENDSINVFNFMNVYTGAGVAVGDLNNDGLTDVYFSGNMVSGRLYINKGNFKFEDITDGAGVLNNRWGTGATMIDINQDGWLDIYVCVSGGAKEPARANMLYINNGPSEDTGEITFTEKAEEYGVADTRQSMHAAFFDFDKDNDLDLYLLVNPAAYEHQVNSSLPRKLDGSALSNDRLYRNDGDGKFTDVSQEAGILVEGYGLGVGIADINNDTWPDIYISNDFIGNDILYINQGDGTFKDQIRDHIKHTSYAGMGNDIADIDNNGEADIIVLDMRPEDNKRQKLIISSTGYDRFQMMLQAGYDAQYSRNTLQLNMGDGQFSEIGFLAGVSSTDWSWSGLFADYDNDGFKDLYITNGFLRDLGNLDYIHYQGIYDNPLGERETKKNLKLKSIRELPSAKLVNYVYKNNGDASFKNVSKDWGITQPSCSNGAAYADLDNDGDLDLLINNVNQPAFIYENKSEKSEINNFLKIKLLGQQGNLEGIGASIKITTDSSKQYYEHYLSRGYESSIDHTIHFGLGSKTQLDSLEIRWPDGTYQSIQNIAANQLVRIKQSEAIVKQFPKTKNMKEALLTNTTDSLGIAFKHHEDQMVDFKLQPILPHMHSRNGPGLAVADVNQNGHEDFYIGGAAGQNGQLYIQNKDSFENVEISNDSIYEDMGALFFDANNDGAPDLYVVSGGVQNTSNKNIYQDRLYINNGKGAFTKSNALPTIDTSGSCVTAADFDKDGDLDLFVGARVNPGKYPLPSKSQLLENLSDDGSGVLKFKNITDSIESWEKLSMVTSALWTDYDNDGWIDLIAVGEFMPITFFHNEKGKLVYSPENKPSDTEGWWNSIAGGDFDKDGDIDYIIGNLGLNNKYHASKDEPLCIYAKDYDKDGNIDPVMCYYKDGENYIAHSRDEIIRQISAMRARFKTYESYAETTFEKSFLPEELKDAYVVKSHLFSSSYMQNNGDGTFTVTPLIKSTQMGPIEGMVIEDINQDGKLDVLLSGNSYSTEVATGRYDALKGIVLLGNGDGTFKELPNTESGFLNDLDASGMALFRSVGGASYVLVANNNGPLHVFENNASSKYIMVPNESTYAEITFTDGTKEKVELYYGSGYLSQGTRSISINDYIKEVKIINVKGKTNTLYSK